MHTGSAGHSGFELTNVTLMKHFKWSNMRDDTKTFINSCIHCQSTNEGETIPGPLGHAMHATKPNEILHFDYCYMESGEDGYKYVLLLKDDLSGYVMLNPTVEADANTTSTALNEWFTIFSIVHTCISDLGSYFKNQVITEIKEKLHAHHYFTVPYCSLCSGSVEVVCGELLRSARKVLS